MGMTGPDMSPGPSPVRRISLRERSAVVRPLAGRVAAVAVPLVRHPAFGKCMVVTRRSTINGHTGGRMSHAGDVVLFGGSVEADETPKQAALRELCEESGTLDLLGALAPGAHLGTWITESRILAEGYAVDLPSTFVEMATADAREVAEIAYLRVADVRAAPITLAYHRIHALDHHLGEAQDVEFESPTIRVPHPVTGEPWLLWGLAGFMVSQWRAASC